jgi:hypothetical protein
MPYIIPQHLIGKMPCMWCGQPVSTPSMDGPGVCPACDTGMKWDSQLGKMRQWQYTDQEYKRYMRGQPHEDFLFALWSDPEGEADAIRS